MVIVHVDPVILPSDICPSCSGIANVIEVEWESEDMLVTRDVHLENLRRLSWRLLTTWRKAKRLEDMREVMQELQSELTAKFRSDG